ncbi:hypothetical protein HRbin01_00919 [archaeon HR01]|nr:hypothetical protein HRbin01_00919 [archaeon HR01]
MRNLGKNSKVGLKFILDTMLGNLLTWLRLLGYDTLYWHGERDDELLEVSRSEGRIIITRDRRLHSLASKSGAESILVVATETVEALKTLQEKLGLKMFFNPDKTRCPKCNTLLVKTSVTPQKWSCPGCGKTYWKGRHWKNIEKVLGELDRHEV